MSAESFKRKLTAILSADVKGYSRLMGEDEDATIRTLSTYRELMATLIQKHRGRVVDSPGDNLLAEFLSVVDAVRCAVEIQEELRVRNDELPENRRMEVRIGINLGDVVEEGERIYGDGVNIAARVEGLAEGGGICISGTVYDSIKNKLSLGYESMGEHTVKNIKEPVRVYRMRIGPEAAAPVKREEKAGPGRWRRAGLVAVAVLVVIVGAWAIRNFYLRPPRIEPASVDKMAYPLPDKPSIAVLPFDNLSGDPKQTYLADGLTENIIAGLSKIPQMFVIARNSTFTYKGKPVKVQQVAEELGVRYVLEGSTQSSGEHLRVTAQLIDALNGHHVWSEKYDRKLENFFGVQDDITLKIAIALQVKLTEGEQARVRHSTHHLEAWTLAVKAHGLFETYALENIAEARELFKKAVEMDPNYAYAWSYLGWTYYIDGVFYSAKYDRKKSFESAAKMAEKALSVDNQSSDAHALLSNVYLSQEKYDEAEALGRKTIDLDPNSSENHAIVAITLQSNGKFQEAIALLKQAMRLNPYYPNWYLVRLGMCYRMVGMYEESAEAFEEVIRRSRKGEGIQAWDRLYLYLAATYSMMGRLKEARDCVSKALEFNPKMTVGLWGKRLQYKNPEHTNRTLDALRKAGLPDQPPLPLPDKPSIAVLPFVNMSGDPKQEHFSDGITEQIITGLSRVPKLFVIARTSSFKYKGKDVDIRTVGRELGIRYVLEGSVQKSGNRLRITAQLIDAIEGQHIWSERYDRELKDIFALQDEITMKIMTAMQIKVTSGEQRRALEKGTDNFEAYIKYIESYEVFWNYNREDNLLSRRLASEAIALDPGFGLAYSVLGWTHYMENSFGWGKKSPEQSLSQAMELGKKALDLNDLLDCAHGLLSLCYRDKKEYEKMIAEATRAVEVAPDSERALHYFGNSLITVGRPEEAIPVYEKAMRLSPFPQTNTLAHLGEAYLLTGRYEEAISMCKRSIDVRPSNLWPHIYIIAAYVAANRDEEARTEAEKVPKLNPKFSVDFVKTMLKYKRQTDTDLIVNGLRKAGIK